MTDTVAQNPRVIDGWEAVRILREVAAPVLDENENYVYQPVDGSCVNLVMGSDGNYEGSCLIGRALLSLGVKPDSDWEAGSFASVKEEDAFKNANLKFTRRGEWVFHTAQNLQDGYMPWRHVIHAVDTGVGNLWFVTDADGED